MSGTFTLLEAASRYGLSDTSVFNYIRVPEYGALVSSVEAAAGTAWKVGSPLTITGTLSGWTLVASGTIYQYRVDLPQTHWQPGLSVNSMILESPTGEAVATFSADYNHPAISGESSAMFPVDGTVAMNGNSGSNRFVPSLGTTMLAVDGGGGVDVVDLRIKDALGQLVHATGQTVGTGSNGEKVVNCTLGSNALYMDLVNVERVVAADWAVAFDVQGHAGQALRLYQAAFNRAPDSAGLGFQMNALDAGWGLHDIAQNFLDSPEFLRLFGNNAADDVFVTALYANVLHRAPDAAGFAYQLNALHFIDRAQLLVNFSESPENQANVIGATSGGIWYTPYQ